MRHRKPLVVAGVLGAMLVAAVSLAEDAAPTLPRTLPPGVEGPEPPPDLVAATEDEEDAFDENAEVLIVRPPSAPDGDEDADAEEDETPLRAAERRIETLEARVSELETALEAMESRQAEMEEALARVEEIEESLVERERQREEAAAARAARATGLDALAAELEGIFETLGRGSDAVERPLIAAGARLESLASEAARFGQSLEAERLLSASRAIDTARSALRRRDLYETRLHVGLALGQVRAARDLARSELAPR